MRIAVLGGGVSGVVIARELARTPTFRIDLLERNPELGGLHRSVEIEGAWYDPGAHLFDPDHPLLRAFPVLYDRFVPVRHFPLSLTRRYSLDAFPFSLRGYARDYGIGRLLADAADLVLSRFRFRRRDSLAACMRYQVGNGLYLRSGLKGYVERMYGLPDTEIDSEFALQPLLPEEWGLQRNAPPLLRELSGRGETGRNCYVRPPEGFPAVYRIVERELADQGVRLRKNARTERIERHGRGYRIFFADAAAERYDLVISTVPISAAMNLVGRPAPFVQEGTRLISLCYRFRGNPGLERGTMLFNFTAEGDWKRINFLSSYYGRLNGDHYFVVECTARRKDPRDMEYMRHSFEKHIARSPVLKGALMFQGGVVTENTLPFFRRADAGYVESARRALQDFGIIQAGRHGRIPNGDAGSAVTASRDMAWELRAKYGYATFGRA